MPKRKDSRRGRAQRVGRNLKQKEQPAPNNVVSESTFDACKSS